MFLFIFFFWKKHMHSDYSVTLNLIFIFPKTILVTVVLPSKEVWRIVCSLQFRGHLPLVSKPKVHWLNMNFRYGASFLQFELLLLLIYTWMKLATWTKIYNGIKIKKTWDYWLNFGRYIKNLFFFLFLQIRRLVFSVTKKAYNSLVPLSTYGTVFYFDERFKSRNYVTNSKYRRRTKRSLGVIILKTTKSRVRN